MQIIDKRFILKLAAFQLLILTSLFCSPAKAQLIDYNFEEWVQPVPVTNKFVDPNYFIWCGSVMKEPRDGKYYMLYSRWPRTDGFYSWAVTSEIAVAVSDKPGGPFKHLKLALPPRGTKFWDGSATHNPALTYYKGKYYLYYMGLSSTTPMTFPITGMSSEAWYSYRNKQRIGVAVADSLSGDWTRFDKPVVDVDTTNVNNPDYDAVNNPSAIATADGKVLIVYKQIAKGTDWHAGAVRCGAATADNPLGPFVKYPKLIFAPPAGSTTLPVEDPYLWYKNGYYYAIMRDAAGLYTGDNSALVLMTSPDGFDWVVAKHPKVLGAYFSFEDGTKNVSRVERPCLLHENGVPIYFYGATRGDAGMTYSYNVAIPLSEPKIVAKKDSVFNKTNGRIIVSGTNGADGSEYKSFKVALDSIQAQSQIGKDILISVKDTVADTNQVVISGQWTKMTIRPATPNAMLYAIINSAFIKLSGAKNVVFDGRVVGKGTDRNLIIRNADTYFSQAIKFVEDASNNIVKHCRIESNSKNATVLFSNAIVSGNNSNIIDSCTIGEENSLATMGVSFENSSTSVFNTGNVVSNCSIFNIGSIAGGSPTGINVALNTNSTSLLNNKIFWTKKMVPSAVTTYYGINNSGLKTIINSNTIGYANDLSTGKSVFENANVDIKFLGIVTTGSTVATEPSLIKNNTIANVSLTTQSVGDAIAGVMSGIYVKALTNSYVNISGNTLKNISLKYAGSKSSSVYWTLTGILSFASDNNISGNTLDGLSAIGTTDATINMLRVIHVDKTATLSAKISQNLIANITSGSSTSTASNQIYGMFSGAQGQSTVERNLIYNLNALNAGLTSLNVGILLYNQSTTSTATSIVKNNMIRLGSSISQGSAFYGILQQDNKSASAKISIYNNSIYIGGTVTTPTTSASACLYRQVSKVEAPIDLKNNIFVNMRSGGTTGVHSIYKLTAATDYSSSFASCNNNLYYTNGAASMGMVASTPVTTFANWKTTTAYDGASYFSDPAFVASDALVPDLHILKSTKTDVDKKASDLLAIVSDDFDGELRSAFTPNDFGADAFISDSDASDIETIMQNRFNVYCNKNQLKINGQINERCVAMINDLSGRMLSKSFINVGTSNVVDVSNLKSGIYILKISDAIGIQNFKFKKE
jgi:hypothetical protein